MRLGLGTVCDRVRRRIDYFRLRTEVQGPSTRPGTQGEGRGKGKA